MCLVEKEKRRPLTRIRERITLLISILKVLYETISTEKNRFTWIFKGHCAACHQFTQEKVSENNITE